MCNHVCQEIERGGEKNSRLARWAIFLQGYQFDITQKKGRIHSNADALSRREYPQEQNIAIIQGENKTMSIQVQTEAIYTDFDPLACVNEISTGTKEELIEFQRNDSDFKDFIAYMVDKELPNRGRFDKRVILESQDYVLDEGVLYHFYYPKGRGHCVDRLVKQLAVPHQLRDDVLRSYYDSLLEGHQGKDRTYQTICYKYFCPSLHADISTYVQTCISCQRAKDDKY